MSGPDWKTMVPQKRDERLIALCREGWTATQIACQFTNVTRNGVIGRLHRLQKRMPDLRLANAPRAKGSGKKASPRSTGTARRKPTYKPAPDRPRPFGTVAAAAPEPVDTRKEEPGQDETVVIDRQFAFDPIPGATPVALTDFTSTTCKWPVDGIYGRDRLFCGCRCEPERSYCEAHAALATTSNHGNRETHDGQGA